MIKNDPKKRDVSRPRLLKTTLRRLDRDAILPGVIGGDSTARMCTTARIVSVANDDGGP